MAKEKLAYETLSQEQPSPEEERKELEKTYKDFKPYAELVKLPEWEKVCELMKDDAFNNLHHTEDGVWYHRSWGIKMFMEAVKQRAEAFHRAEAKLSEGSVK